jgi:hypothetical protein
MKLEFVPLLRMQRELYSIPRGMERFHTYISAMIDPETRDLKLPISAMNPMGRDHVPALLDQYLAFDADGVAAQAVSEAAARLSDAPGGFRVALVVADDARGQWTNRTSTEFGHRFGSKPLVRRGWLVGLLWTSERPSVQTVREEVLTTVYRGAHIQQHGYARTLREMLAQEGSAMAKAGCAQPTLDAAELACTREVIAAHLDTKHHPTLIACLFGDEAADSLGHPPLGLSARAGFALALSEARLNA